MNCSNNTLSSAIRSASPIKIRIESSGKLLKLFQGDSRQSSKWSSLSHMKTEGNLYKILNGLKREVNSPKLQLNTKIELRVVKSLNDQALKTACLRPFK